MTSRYTSFRYISSDPDFSHLTDRNRYRVLYNEVGHVEANRSVRWREEWMRYFMPREGASILELGAHNGPNLIHYGRLGHRVDGVEISDSLVETFQRFKAHEPQTVQKRICMFHGWIEDFEPPQLYDYVLCTEILEHVPDPIAVLRVARKALNSDGLVYITSPTSRWGNNTHVRGVPVKSLERWLSAAMLIDVTVFVKDGRTFALARGR